MIPGFGVAAGAGFLAPVGDFASDISGTSFAAPLVTGVIGLMLQANPNLGLRDVQNILALTARQTDPTSASWAFNGASTRPTRRRAS